MEQDACTDFSEIKIFFIKKIYRKFVVKNLFLEKVYLKMRELDGSTKIFEELFFN